MTSPAVSGVASSVLRLRSLLALGANLLPAYGVLYLGVDPFQVLMLYWMETAVISFWMVMTLGRLPPHGIPVHLEFTSGGKRTTLDINKES